MARTGIKFTFKGFDELVEKIQNAGGSIDGAVNDCMTESAQIMQDELKASMRKTKVASSLISRMPPPSVEWNGNTCTAEVGYEKGKYDPKNLSDGYKAVFLNYGTPRITPRKFIVMAKKKASRQIKKQQEKTLTEILEGLKK